MRAGMPVVVVLNWRGLIVIIVLIVVSHAKPAKPTTRAKFIQGRRAPMATEPRNISEEYQKLTDSARRTVVGLVF
jgi:hypothetical protein